MPLPIRILVPTLPLIVCLSAFATDLDENGIDDAVDQKLIARYRPHLYYDSSEGFWPCSFVWFVQHSVMGKDGRSQVVFENDVLVANPLQILDPSASPNWSFFGGFGSSIAGGDFDNVGYYLKLDSSSRAGEGPIPVGMYAHVVQLTGPIVQDNYPKVGVQSGDLLVQYFQLFAFNDPMQTDGADDHDGDLLFLEVYLHSSALFEPTADSIIGIVYHHHGDGSCFPTLIPGDYPKGGGRVSIPSDGTPKCYLESGGHEWWPWPGEGSECTFCIGEELFGDCLGFTIDNNGHNGFGVSYLSENVLNLGQRFAPMPGDEPQMVLFFNGKWGNYTGPGGDPPLGPILQLYPSSPLFVAYVDPSAPTRASANGVGSRFFPLQTLSNAQQKVEQTLAELSGNGNAGRILLKPGTYSGKYEFDKAMTLEAWGNGVVTIGQSP